MNEFKRRLFEKLSEHRGEAPRSRMEHEILCHDSHNFMAGAKAALELAAEEGARLAPKFLTDDDPWYLWPQFLNALAREIGAPDAHE